MYFAFFSFCCEISRTASTESGPPAIAMGKIRPKMTKKATAKMHPLASQVHPKMMIKKHKRLVYSYSRQQPAQEAGSGDTSAPIIKEVQGGIES